MTAGSHTVQQNFDLTTANWMASVGISEDCIRRRDHLGLDDKREALAKAKPLLKRNGKTGSWRQNRNLITWLENL